MEIVDVLLVMSITGMALWRREIFLYITAIVALVLYSVQVSETYLEMSIPLWLLAIYMALKIFTYYFRR